jgi:hypothetical protein
MISEEVKKTASQCRHYAMCKIDYLGTGLCPAGREHQYVAYYPQGRMDLCHALAEGIIPVTEGLLDIARTCTLCGLCDLQCHFVTGMRPMKVMKALKEHVESSREAQREIARNPDDEILARLKEIVGEKWATNDAAILFAYADDPFPLTGRQVPGYVVLPGAADEVGALVRLSNDCGLPYAVRGNGGSVFGLVFTSGLVIDMNRMKKIEIDPENWCAIVEAGVTSFDLQAEAFRYHMRANAAEPAATVCGNIICTGTFSTWANVYGTAADNFIDMEFIDENGRLFRLTDRTSPNVFALANDGKPSTGICTRARVKLHPITDDEEGVLVPFRHSRRLSLLRGTSARGGSAWPLPSWGAITWPRSCLRHGGWPIKSRQSSRKHSTSGTRSSAWGTATRGMPSGRWPEASSMTGSSGC